MSQDEKIMMPARVATLAIHKTDSRTIFYPNGVLGGWEEFASMADAIKHVGTGTYVLVVADGHNKEEDS